MIKKQGEVTHHPIGETGKKIVKKNIFTTQVSKSQAFLQRGQIGRDNMQWQTLIAKCTGKNWKRKQVG